MFKQKVKIFSLFSFFFSLIFTFSLGEIFYNSIDGTDFYRYFRYIEYFNGTIDTPSREQVYFISGLCLYLLSFLNNFMLQISGNIFTARRSKLRILFFI